MIYKLGWCERGVNGCEREEELFGEVCSKMTSFFTKCTSGRGVSTRGTGGKSAISEPKYPLFGDFWRHKQALVPLFEMN
jgi:hypothetical protein